MKAPQNPRIKTEEKASKKIHFPVLSPSKRMKTIDINAHIGHKFSEKMTSKSMTKKDLGSIKVIEKENVFKNLSGKGMSKVKRRKHSPLDFIVVRSLSSKEKSKTEGNIVAVVCDQYQGLREYNEDRICMSKNMEMGNKIYHFFAVFDGHGGSAVSQYLKANMVKQFQALVKNFGDRHICDLLKQTLHQMEQEVIEKQLAGGSCASILVIHENRYYIANVGDSRILRVQNENDEGLQQLTNDHKPDDSKEKQRIESFGGKIYRNKVKVASEEAYGPYRVLPGRLSVSRTIGDNSIKKQGQGRIVISEADTIQGQLSEQDLFLVMSDGGYERFTNQQICKFFSQKQTAGNLKKSLQTYFINSILRETSDNISIICVLTQSVKAYKSNKK